MLFLVIFSILVTACSSKHESKNEDPPVIDLGNNGGNENNEDLSGSTNNSILDARFTTNLVNGVAPLTVEFTVTNITADAHYDWAFGDGSNATGTMQTHTYTEAGTYLVKLTATDLDLNQIESNQDIDVYAEINNSSANVPSGVLFFDDFNYSITRDDTNASGNFIAQGGWEWVKTQQSYGSGSGYIHTTNSIPGYNGQFPGINSDYVLLIEMLPATFGGQTDVYLQYGCEDCPVNTIPGDVWFQFWIYINNYGTQQSRFSGKNKFIYPCNAFYACGTNKWLFSVGTSSLNPMFEDTSDENLFVYSRDERVGFPYYSALDDLSNANKIGQQDTSVLLIPNRWTLLKIHFDTSKTSGNRFETWIKPIGEDWSKTVEWIGGVTPNFTWTFPAGEEGGHRVFRMPSTFPGGVGSGDGLYDSWIYMDDFAMADAESNLPVYPY